MSGGLRLHLHVEEQGEGEPTLLLIHGFGAHGFTWRHWAPELARSHRLLTVDLKGFGDAPKPQDEDYSPVDQANLLLRMVRGRNTGPLILVGHSYGGAVAMVLALLLLDREAHRLAGLALVAGAPYPQALPRYMALAASPVVGDLMLRLVPGRTIIRAALRSAYHDPELITRNQVEAYAEPLATREGRRGTLRAVRGIFDDDAEAWVSRYREIDVPVLLLWGREDRIVPLDTARRLERDLPRAELVVLDACGHVPQEEKPRESLAALRDFLARLGGAGEGSAGQADDPTESAPGPGERGA